MMRGAQDDQVVKLASLFVRLVGVEAFAALFSGLDVADFGDQVAVLIDDVVRAVGEGAAVAGQGEQLLECGFEGVKTRHRAGPLIAVTVCLMPLVCIFWHLRQAH